MPKTVTQDFIMQARKTMRLIPIVFVVWSVFTLNNSHAQSPVPYKVNPFPAMKQDSSQSQETIGIKHFQVPVQKVHLNSIMGRSLKSKTPRVGTSEQTPTTHRRGPTRRGGPVRGSGTVKTYPAPVGPLPFQRLAPPSGTKQLDQDITDNVALPVNHKIVPLAIPNVPEDVMDARPAKKRVLAPGSPVQLPEIRRNVAVKSTLKPQPLITKEADDTFDPKEWVAFKTHKPPTFFTAKALNSARSTQEPQQLNRESVPRVKPPLQMSKTESSSDNVMQSEQDARLVEQPKHRIASIPRQPVRPEAFPSSENNVGNQPQPDATPEAHEQPKSVPPQHSEEKPEKISPQGVTEGEGWIQSLTKRVRKVFRSKTPQTEEISEPAIDSFPTPPMSDEGKPELQENTEAGPVEPSLESLKKPTEPSTTSPPSDKADSSETPNVTKPSETASPQPEGPPPIETVYPGRKSGLALISDRIRNIFKKKPTRVLAQTDREQMPTIEKQVPASSERDVDPGPSVKPAVVGPNSQPEIAPSQRKDKESWFAVVSERLRSIVNPRKNIIVREIPTVQEPDQRRSREETPLRDPSETREPEESSTSSPVEAPAETQSPQENQPAPKTPSNGWPSLASIPERDVTDPSSESRSVMEPPLPERPTEQVVEPPATEQPTSAPTQPEPKSAETTIIASPLDHEAEHNYHAKQYLQETAPILEKVSLLITRAPSIEIADYDPSDPNFTMISHDVLLKMESIKRDLQIIDAKTFNIIPPSEYGQFHSMIRDSISHTHQACDAIMGFLKDGNSDQLPAVQDHLIRARKLIQRARQSAG